MGYRSKPRMKSDRSLERHRRERSKTKSKKSCHSEAHLKEQNTSSPEEMISRTVNSLHNLGSQMFTLAPYYDYFDRWLANLNSVLIDFESSQLVAWDNQFREECSRILSDVELSLRNKRLEEASRTETVQGFYVLRNKHAQIEQEQITKMKEITDRKEHTVKALVDRVEAIQKELDNISCIRTGFFRGISKKTKSQKEEEANLRLVSAKKELEESMKSLAVDEITLREEYEHRKSEVLEQTACDLKEIERLETASQIDNSAEVRQITCEKLTDAIVSLKNRVEPIPKN